MHLCLSYCGNIMQKGPISLIGLSIGHLQGKENQLLARYAKSCWVPSTVKSLSTRAWNRPSSLQKCLTAKVTWHLLRNIYFTHRNTYTHTNKKWLFFGFFVFDFFFFLPKCKLDEDPCDESDGGGVSECPGVWLGRGMPIGLGEEENPRLL